MKYLKKSSEVLIGKAGSQDEQKLTKHGFALTDHTAMLTLVTHYSDGSGEELSGLCVTHEHLEQIRKAIDDYLLKTDNNIQISKETGSVNNFNFKVETGLTEAQTLNVFDQVSQQVKQMLQNNNKQKQTQLAICPKLVTVNQLLPEGQNSWSAKLRLLSGLKDFSTDGKIELSVMGSSEKEVRAKLNTGFCDLIMACVNPDSSVSRIPDIFHENQQPVNSIKDTRIKRLRLDIINVTSKKTNEVWEARIPYWDGCNKELTSFGDTETEARTQLYKELIFLLQDQLSACYFSDTTEPGSTKQVNKTDDKDVTQFKLNPSRVMSIKIGSEKWEARTRIFNGINAGLTDLVATGVSEEAAREELDKKFSDFAEPMTNFIKFMSQAF